MRVALVLCLFWSACSGPWPAPPSEARHQANAALQACAAVEHPEQVTTISAAISRLNALPTPVSPACFVASLARPLDVVATTSIFSAQPAASRESPRMFLFAPELVVSVVPEGDGARLLEFAQWMTPTRTLKGEVELPFASKLTEEAPYLKTHSTFGVTSCGLCHRSEEPHPTIDGGFVSDAYRPAPDSLVPLSELRAQHEACAHEEQTERCAMFHALFDFGAVREGAFSTSVGLFVE